jgi:hypothetical protein
MKDTDESVEQMAYSLRHHQERIDEAKKLLVTTIVRAHDRLGMTFREIAEAMGVESHTWPYKLYKRAKKRR